MRNGRWLCFAAIGIVLAGCATIGESAAPAGTEDFSKEKTRLITWDIPVREGDSFVISGHLQANFGRFDFFWLITNGSDARLMTKKPLGSAEKGARNVSLYPFFLHDGRAAIFRERLPLLNSREPRALVLVAVVSAEELRAGLTRVWEFLNSEKP